MSLLGRAPVDPGLQQNTNFAPCPWALTSTSSGPEPRQVLPGQVVSLNFSSLTPPLMVSRTIYTPGVPDSDNSFDRSNLITCLGLYETWVNLTDTTFYNWTVEPLEVNNRGSNRTYQKLEDAIIWTAVEWRPNDTSEGRNFEPSDNYTIVAQLSGASTTPMMTRSSLLTIVAMGCLAVMTSVGIGGL